MDKMRWCYGDTNPVVAAVERETVIEIGDLLWLATSFARPAAAMAHASQLLFAVEFLGVAMQRSRAGDDSPIRVAATGVFDFDCPETDFELGDLLAAGVGADDDGRQRLLSQEVWKTGNWKAGIGRCVKRGAALRRVLVDVRSTVMTGGILQRS